MIKEDDESNFVEFLMVLEKLFQNEEQSFGRLDREALATILSRFTNISKKFYQKYKEHVFLAEQMEKIKCQNGELQSQIGYLNQKNQQLEDIKQLMIEQEQRLKKYEEDQSYSRNKIENLQAYSMQLTNQNEMDISKHERIKQKFCREIDNLKDKLQTQKNQILLLTQQLKQQKGKSQQTIYCLTKQLQKQQNLNQSLSHDYGIMDEQCGKLKLKIQDLEYTQQMKVDNSVKSHSAVGDGQMILQVQQQDDQQIPVNSEDDILGLFGKISSIHQTQAMVPAMNKRISGLRSVIEDKKFELRRRNTFQCQPKTENINRAREDSGVFYEVKRVEQGKRSNKQKQDNQRSISNSPVPFNRTTEMIKDERQSGSQKSKFKNKERKNLSEDKVRKQQHDNLIRQVEEIKEQNLGLKNSIEDFHLKQHEFQEKIEKQNIENEQLKMKMGQTLFIWETLRETATREKIQNCLMRAKLEEQIFELVQICEAMQKQIDSKSIESEGWKKLYENHKCKFEEYYKKCQMLFHQLFEFDSQVKQNSSIIKKGKHISNKPLIKKVSIIQNKNSHFQQQNQAQLSIDLGRSKSNDLQESFQKREDKLGDRQFWPSQLQFDANNFRELHGGSEMVIGEQINEDEIDESFLHAFDTKMEIKQKKVISFHSGILEVHELFQQQTNKKRANLQQCSQILNSYLSFSLHFNQSFCQTDETQLSDASIQTIDTLKEDISVQTINSLSNVQTQTFEQCEKNYEGQHMNIKEIPKGFMLLNGLLNTKSDEQDLIVEEQKFLRSSSKSIIRKYSIDEIAEIEDENIDNKSVMEVQQRNEISKYQESQLRESFVINTDQNKDQNALQSNLQAFQESNEYANKIRSQGASTQISPQQSRIEREKQNLIEDSRLVQINEQRQGQYDRRTKRRNLGSIHSESSSDSQKIISAKQNENKTVDNIIFDIIGQKLKLVKDYENIEFEQFAKNFKWDFSKVYEIEAERVDKKESTKDRLIIWRKGLISVQKKLESKIAKGVGKLIQSSGMTILGNSEIIIQKNIIEARKCSRNYFDGNLKEGKWKIKTVSIYH